VPYQMLSNRLDSFLIIGGLTKNQKILMLRRRNKYPIMLDS